MEDYLTYISVCVGFVVFVILIALPKGEIHIYTSLTVFVITFVLLGLAEEHIISLHPVISAVTWGFAGGSIFNIVPTAVQDL